MRELIQLGDLLEQARRAQTIDDIQRALVATLEHLYRKEYNRERGR